MSKVGRLPIPVPSEVNLEIKDSLIKVSGPKGSLSIKFPRGIEVELINGEIVVRAKKESKKLKALHGTCRALISNMVKGVSAGWMKELEMVGAGYRAEMVGETLRLTVGFSHPVDIESPEGISIKAERTLIIIEGADKELVGQMAAKIRAVRKPEPYKGKGIRYKGEIVKRKAGKAAKTQGVAG